MITKFELTERQQKEIQEWMDTIKKVFGEYGSYDYTFSPNGIGVGLIVYSHAAKVEKDFSNVEDW